MTPLLPKRHKNISVHIYDTTKFMALCVFLSWLLFKGSENLGYNWQWYRVPPYFLSQTDGTWVPGLLLQGLNITLMISSSSFVLAFVLGLSSALMRLSESPVASWLSRIYIESIRNTPLLIQIFFVYFILSPILGISRFLSAVLALSLFEGAYASEIFRSGIESLPKGQWEAAYSLGLSPWNTYRHILLPQAFRRILPALTGQTVSLIKDSALVSAVAVYDLTMQAQMIISETFLTFELWFTVAAVYLVFTLGLSTLASQLEKRWIVGT